MSKGIVIGAGHNGLVAACYLAKAGHDIDVFEARGIVGGAAVTEDFHPGFSNSTASYTVSLLHPKVIKDLNLHKHGLRIVERAVNNLLPLKDGRYLASYPDLVKSQASIAQFSQSDAQQLPRYYADLDEVVPVIQWIMTQIPPNGVEGGLGDIFKAFQLSRQFASLQATAKNRLLKLFSLSAAEFLSEYFESEAIQALFGFDAVVGHFDSPYSPGSAYVLLHHVVGGVNGKSGNWGHAIGGMGAITQCMAREAEALGVRIHTDASIDKVLTTNARARGVVLANGDQHQSNFVVANINPRLLMESNLEDEAVPTAIKNHFRHYKNQSGTFRLNVALNGLPKFTCDPEPQALEGGIIMAPSLDYMDAAYQSARQNHFSKAPIVEMLIPSIVDGSLIDRSRVNQTLLQGPKETELHVASLFCQHFDPSLKDQWDKHKNAAIDAIFEVVETHAPGFRESVIAVQSHSPWDLEKKFGLLGGDIFHGRLSLEQLFSARPMLGMGQYKTHIEGLFLCGSGTHPGGGVSGIPGMNAAREIIRHL